MPANREYKSSVFSLLFSDPELLRELYGAIAGVILPPDLPITVNTLEGVLFRNRINDISFGAGGKLVIVFEHQSSINPNMPLRILQYIGRVYEKLTAGLKAFGRKLIKIPRPEFIVLYNGVDPYPDESILNLSDAFEDVSDLGIELPPDLELRVKVYNINKGHNEEKLRKCGALAGYSEFVGKVREITAEMTGGRVPLKLSDEELSKAIKGAMGWCIGHDVLREFFERNGSEVMNMLFNEFSLEDELAVEREVAWEEGREERETEIAKNALAEGLPVEVIRKITGLDQATLTQLAAQ